MKGVRTEFVTSAAAAAGFPRETLPEVAMVGRSNVGKSSLINALVGRSLARTSAAPGKTRLANFYRVDADRQPLSGSNRYRLVLDANQLPPVNAFWSLTLYELPSSLLCANPLNRYLINSAMLAGLSQARGGASRRVS